MERKTIGKFLSALRKARGMTQQEVADRLNVSNKTVSKWERDEGYPEITIIPAIAELFEVTSDEILRGERLPKTHLESGAHGIRVEKQLRQIVNSSITRFKNNSFLAAALALVGLICLFTIAYTFYRPVLGFGIMLIFVIASITTGLVTINISQASIRNQELLPENSALLDSLNKTVNRYSFALLLTNLAVVILSLPFLLVRDSYYVESVITMEAYLSLLPVLALVILLLSGLLITLFREKLFLDEHPWFENFSGPEMRRLNLVQGLFLALALTFALIDIFHSVPFKETGSIYITITGFYVMAGLALITMAVLIVKSKPGLQKYLLLAAGIRNLLYALAGLYAISGIIVFHTANGESSYHYRYTPGTLIILLAGTAAYLLFRYYAGRRRNSG